MFFGCGADQKTSDDTQRSQGIYQVKKGPKQVVTGAGRSSVPSDDLYSHDVFSCRLAPAQVFTDELVQQKHGNQKQLKDQRITVGQVALEVPDKKSQITDQNEDEVESQCQQPVPKRGQFVTDADVLCGLYLNALHNRGKDPAFFLVRNNLRIKKFILKSKKFYYKITMRETKFIRQNSEKWRELEDTLGGEAREPEKLYDLFVGVMDDLAYARTHFPGRSVKRYLNGLAQHLFIRLYNSGRHPVVSFRNFWFRELPFAIYKARPEFLFAGLAFLLAMGMGVLSSALEPDFIRVILGDAYVDMTLENIDSGDPLAVYKDADRLGMFVGITTNNLLIALKTFVYGILFAAGSVVVLLQNGIMLGAFHYFFAERGLLTETLLTVWIHGSLEISAIIIAGAAGITMGKGWIFPGTLSRGQSFRRSARKGLKIMVGVVPVFILAGFIEAYLTRYTATPNVIRMLFIASCFLLIGFYFVWLPRRVGRMGLVEGNRADELLPVRARDIRWDSIKTAGQVFQEVFVVYRQNISRLLRLNLGFAIAYVLLLFLGSFRLPSELLHFPDTLFGTFNSLEQFFAPGRFPAFTFLLIPLLSLLLFQLGRVLDPPEEKRSKTKGVLFRMFQSLVAAASLVLVIRTGEWYTKLLLVTLFPAIVFWFYTMTVTQTSPLRALGRSIYLLQQAFGRLLSLSLSITLMGLLLLLFTEATLMQFVLDWSVWVVDLSPDLRHEANIVFRVFSTIFILIFVFILLFTGLALSYYSLEEIADAGTLKADIERIGR